MGVKSGWRGRFFEDFEVGDVYRHPLGRTVTETDNTWFTLLTMNTNEAHFNAEVGRQSEFGKPLVVSTLTIAIAIGQSVTDTTGSVSYVYDADGNRLISRDTTGRTLYLANQEVRYTNSTAKSSCTRYYSFGGGTVAQRTAKGITCNAVAPGLIVTSDPMAKPRIN